MNWAILIVGAEVLFSGAYWVYAARYKYMKESVLRSTPGACAIPVINGEPLETGAQVVEKDAMKKVLAV